MKEIVKRELNVPLGYKFEELYDVEDLEYEFGPPIKEEEVNVKFGEK